MKIEKINELFGRYAEQLLRVHWLTLAAFAIVIVLSVVGIKRMVKETSFDYYFHADRGMFTVYKKNSELFFKLKYSF